MSDAQTPIRLLQTEGANGPQAALMIGEDACALLPGVPWATEILGFDAEVRTAMFAQARQAAATPLAQTKLASLASPSAAVWAIALNYDSHVNEGGHKRPEHPMMFLRLPASFAGHGQALLKPRSTAQFDYEGELAVFIGKPGADIPKSEALGHVGAYACCNEGSVREWQRHTTQITPGKNFWRSGSLGPWLQLADGYDPGPRILRTTVNGQEVQRARVDEMLFKIDEVIAYVSQIAPLAVGDVILMGTPGGVGLRRNPQLFLNDGDEVCVEIEGLGALSNPVRDR